MFIGVLIHLVQQSSKIALVSTALATDSASAKRSRAAPQEIRSKIGLLKTKGFFAA
jgi:hypothetical protein